MHSAQPLSYHLEGWEPHALPCKLAVQRTGSPREYQAIACCGSWVCQCRCRVAQNERQHLHCLTQTHLQAALGRVSLDCCVSKHAELESTELHMWSTLPRVSTMQAATGVLGSRQLQIMIADPYAPGDAASSLCKAGMQGHSWLSGCVQRNQNPKQPLLLWEQVLYGADPRMQTQPAP